MSLRQGTVYTSVPTLDLKERYRLLYGTKEEIDALRFSHVIYREYGEYGSCAFLECAAGEDYGRYETRAPRLDDIMYCLEKGGYGDVSDHA